MVSDSKRPPQIVLSALCRLVDLIDQKLLLAHAPKKYFQSHRPIPKNAPILRKRLRLEVQKSSGTDDLVKQFLRLAPAPEVGAVPQFSEQFISRNLEHLANFFGRPEFLAACWLDDRDFVREYVFSRAEDWIGSTVSEGERKRSLESISSEFQFVRAMLATTEGHQGGGSDDTAKADPSLADETAKKLLESQRDREILQGKYEKKIGTLQAIIERQSTEVRELQASISTRRDRENELLEHNKMLRGKLAALEQGIESQVRLAVSAQFEKEVCRWLWQPRAIETKIAESEVEDLTVKARRLLDRQRAHDRHYGNIHELRGRIAQRSELLEQLEHAQANSLKPLPDLLVTIRALKAEIDKLSAVLADGEADLSKLASSMLARVNGVSSLTDLSRFRSFVETAESIALLSAFERDRLHEALDATHERLLVPYPITLEVTGTPMGQRKHPLLDAVSSGQPFNLFLDGHNILYRLSDVFGGFFEHGLPGMRARERLVDLVAGIFRNAPARVALYFDGNQPGTEVHSDEVRIIYSGGEGKNRADFAMLAAMEEHQQAHPSERVLLVSSDFHLLKEAVRRGAVTMTAEEFAEQVL